MLCWPLGAQFITHTGGALRGTVTSLGQSIPDPVFSNPFNDGTGATATSDFGDNCSLASFTWVEDPTSSGNWTIDADALNTEGTCGTALDGMNEGTWMAWLLADTYGENGLGRVIWKATSSAAHSWRMALTNGSGEGEVRFGVCDNTATSVCDVFGMATDTFDACIGVWCHVAFKVTGCASMGCTGAQWYINGSPVSATVVNDATGTRRSDGSDTVRIASVSGTNTFDGHLDDIRVYSTPLSDAQVAAIYAAGRE